MERLRAAVQHTFAGRLSERGVTVSLGLADLGPARTTPGEMLAAADAALYRAKQGGRNRWAACGVVPSTPEALDGPAGSAGTDGPPRRPGAMRGGGG
jgi:hypothetical protein